MSAFHVAVFSTACFVASDGHASLFLQTSRRRSYRRYVVAFDAYETQEG